VLNPALIGRGEPMEVLVTFGAAVIGVVLVASALQGYLAGVGRMTAFGPVGWASRLLLLAAGVIMMMPGGELVGYSHTTLNIVAVCLAVPAIAITWLGRDKKTLAAGG